MSTAREQVIEGRDEALHHLEIGLDYWEKWGRDNREIALMSRVILSPLDKAAAITVAQAEAKLVQGGSINARIESLQWAVFSAALSLKATLTQADMVLVA